jgi:hypothetical protein
MTTTNANGHLILDNGKTFRIRFVPAGADKPVTRFGHLQGGDKLLSFKRLRGDGTDWAREHWVLKDGVKTLVVTEEVMLIARDGLLEQTPMVMNLHFGELEPKQ